MVTKYKVIKPIRVLGLVEGDELSYNEETNLYEIEKKAEYSGKGYEFIHTSNSQFSQGTLDNYKDKLEEYQLNTSSKNEETVVAGIDPYEYQDENGWEDVDIKEKEQEDTTKEDIDLIKEIENLKQEIQKLKNPILKHSPFWWNKPSFDPYWYIR